MTYTNKILLYYFDQFINVTAEERHLVETDSTTSLFYIYRYDITTGTFTVPPGGDGFYYFSVYLRFYGDQSAGFEVEINGELLCTVAPDLTETDALDLYLASCSSVAYAAEGIYIRMYLEISIQYLVHTTFKYFLNYCFYM